MLAVVGTPDRVRAEANPPRRSAARLASSHVRERPKDASRHRVVRLHVVLGPRAPALGDRAIATDSVDSRKWKIPDSPKELLGRAVAVLTQRGAVEADTLASARGGEVWIDFVADMVDDVYVSEAVARLFAAEYEVDFPGSAEPLLLPRGDVLILGGDLAYPVGRCAR